MTAELWRRCFFLRLRVSALAAGSMAFGFFSPGTCSSSLVQSSRPAGSLRFPPPAAWFSSRDAVCRVSCQLSPVSAARLRPRPSFSYLDDAYLVWPYAPAQVRVCHITRPTFPVPPLLVCSDGPGLPFRQDIRPPQLPRLAQPSSRSPPLIKPTRPKPPTNDLAQAVILNWPPHASDLLRTTFYTSLSQLAHGL